MPETRELAQIIDRETGDVNNLRDKKLADATAQQQSGSASTDSVVMKTTGGEYVEIARDSFVGAIKSVMDGLIKGNSYTTLGANDPIAAFNSNALGGITPANLASVLGEPLGLILGIYGCWGYTSNGEFLTEDEITDANKDSCIGIAVKYPEGKFVVSKTKTQMASSDLLPATVASLDIYTYSVNAKMFEVDYLDMDAKGNMQKLESASPSSIFLSSIRSAFSTNDGCLMSAGQYYVCMKHMDAYNAIVAKLGGGTAAVNSWGWLLTSSLCSDGNTTSLARMYDRIKYEQLYLYDTAMSVGCLATKSL